MPLIAELHRVATPVYRMAIERAQDLEAALTSRGEALDKAGYYQQVKVTPSSVLVFGSREGARTAIHRRVNGSNQAVEFVIGSDSGAQKLSPAELLSQIDAAPEDFSPNVLLRPVVQDYLLPTLAYAGGAAEAAYFAQVGAVYETISDRVTPIVPRFSATIIDPKVQGKMQHYGITVLDAFQGPDALRHKLASRSLPAGLQQAFDRANQSVEESFSSLQESLAKLDPTLVEASQTGSSKVRYQLDRLRERAMAAELRRSEVVGRHADWLSNTLYPERALQERGVAGAYFMARYGTELLQSIHDVIHSDCHDHQILEIVVYALRLTSSLSALAGSQVGSQPNHNGAGYRSLPAAKYCRRPNLFPQRFGQQDHDQIRRGIQHHRNRSQQYKLKKYVSCASMNELRNE